jgi:rare lipoprotein A
MRTKLRIFGFLSVLSVVWAPLASAAPQKARTHKTSKSTKSNNLNYVGTASWYGGRHQGRKMANGKRFDRNKLTAASWYFPLGTAVRVENLKNGESVVVTITDRGPNRRLHRILDLSQEAAERLDYVGQGLTSVFLYPVVTFHTESVEIDSSLIEPHFRQRPVEYEAIALSPEM